MPDGSLVAAKSGENSCTLTAQDIDRASGYMKLGWAIHNLVFRKAGPIKPKEAKLVTVHFLAFGGSKKGSANPLGCCLAPTSVEESESISSDPESFLNEATGALRKMLRDSGTPEDVIDALIVQQCDHCLHECD